jgi:hypothetical protein
MSQPDEQLAGLDPVALLEWVDEVADRFEAAWGRGLRPRVTDYLGEDLAGQLGGGGQEAGQLVGQVRDLPGDTGQLVGAWFLGGDHECCPPGRWLESTPIWTARQVGRGGLRQRGVAVKRLSKADGPIIPQRQ